MIKEKKKEDNIITKTDNESYIDQIQKEEETKEELEK